MAYTISMSDPWTLAELTEFDLQLRGAAPAEASPLPSSSGTRADLFRSWLLRARAAHPAAAQRAALALRSEHFLRPVLFLFFFFSGLGAAAALLVYDGSRMINVGITLAVLVGLQLLLLAGRAVLGLVLRRPGRLASLFLPAALRGLGDSPALPAWRCRLAIDFHLGGVTFNLGALLATLWLLLARDLAFGWESTLISSAETVHRIVQALAAPWGGAFAPDLASIDASRIFLLRSSPALTPAPAAAWWPFLLACLCFYGLLPRLLLAAAFHLRLRRLLRSPRLDSPACESLFLKLSRRPLSFVGDTHADALPPSPDPLPALRPSAPLYPDIDPELLPPDALDRLRQRLPFALCDAPSAGRLLLVEAWQPPLEETLRRLRDLRQRLGPSADILLLCVGLPHPDPQRLFLPPEPEDLAIWRSRLATLHDPHLGLWPWEASA
jgi:hypothetical protein